MTANSMSTSSANDEHTSETTEATEKSLYNNEAARLVKALDSAEALRSFVTRSGLEQAMDRLGKGQAEVVSQARAHHDQAQAVRTIIAHLQTVHEAARSDWQKWNTRRGRLFRTGSGIDAVRRDVWATYLMAICHAYLGEWEAASTLQTQAIEPESAYFGPRGDASIGRIITSLTGFAICYCISGINPLEWDVFYRNKRKDLNISYSQHDAMAERIAKLAGS